MPIRQYLHESNFDASEKFQDSSANHVSLHNLRVIDGADGWSEFHFENFELPYRDQDLLTTWINGDGEAFGDVGASHD